MTDLRLATYCGLYCGLCGMNCRIPRMAQELQDAMREEGYEYWGGEMAGFRSFWDFLQGLVASGSTHSCREGTCGAPNCSIRKCAQRENVKTCAVCAAHPCAMIEGLAEGYPTLLADARRIRDIGLEVWVEEQEERAKTGFAYADIRCHPYEVPQDRSDDDQ